MKHSAKTFITFTLMFLVGTISFGQSKIMPVTTTSEQARIDFEAGRNSAFHYHWNDAWKFLDYAIEKDSTFVLAYLHRGGMSSHDMEVRAKYFNLAKKYQTYASAAEQKLIRAFEAFLNPERERRDIPLAISILKELHEEFPEDRYLPSYIGLRYLWNLDDYGTAESYFMKAIEIDSAYAQGYHWLGMAYQFQGKLNEAEKAFLKSAWLAPKEARPLHALGNLYLEKGDKRKALSYFNQSLARDPYFRSTNNVIQSLITDSEQN